MNRRTKLKKKSIIFIVVVLTILLIEIINPIFLYRRYRLTNLDYSSISATKIIDSGLYSKALKLGYNKTLDEVIKSKDYDKNNYEYYIKINYVEQENLTSNINELLKLKYTVNDINNINKIASDSDIKLLLKHEYVPNISNYFQYDYAKVVNLDRYIAYQKETGLLYEDVVTRVNIGLDNPYYTDSKEINKFSLSMLVNKYIGLPSHYIPDNLVNVDKEYAVDSKQKLNKEALDAFIKMADDMKKEGLFILVNSGYRNYQYQQSVYNDYLKSYGKNYAEKYAAHPGFSEHQTGLALDVKAKNSNTFKGTKESNWMLKNAYKYGFILRYPSESEDVTGYNYEPWHYRYLGIELAKKVFDSGLTYDEYYVRYLDK